MWKFKQTIHQIVEWNSTCDMKKANIFVCPFLITLLIIEQIQL